MPRFQTEQDLQRRGRPALIGAVGQVASLSEAASQERHVGQVPSVAETPTRTRLRGRWRLPPWRHEQRRGRRPPRSRTRSRAAFSRPSSPRGLAHSDRIAIPPCRSSTEQTRHRSLPARCHRPHPHDHRRARHRHGRDAGPGVDTGPRPFPTSAVGVGPNRTRGTLCSLIDRIGARHSCLENSASEVAFPRSDARPGGVDRGSRRAIKTRRWLDRAWSLGAVTRTYPDSVSQLSTTIRRAGWISAHRVAP